MSSSKKVNIYTNLQIHKFTKKFVFLLDQGAIGKMLLIKHLRKKNQKKAGLKRPKKAKNQRKNAVFGVYICYF